MSFTIPPALQDILAKSPESEGAEGETLVEHTYRVMEKVADQYRLRPNPGSHLHSERFWHRAFWSGFLHDFGKAADGFQKQLLPHTKKAWGKRHEVLSLAFVGWVFPEDHEDWIWIVSTIISHHRDLEEIKQGYPPGLDPDYDIIPEMLEEIPDGVIGGLWEWLSSAPPEWITELGMRDANVELPELADPEPPQEFRHNGYLRIRRALDTYSDFAGRLGSLGAGHPETLTAIAHRGVMVTADHAGSAHAEEFPANPVPDTERLIAELELPGLYAHQEACAGSQEGSVMFAAPTGSGKTEAALLWASTQGEHETAARLYYVLPFQASMNAMQGRISKQFPGSVSLQHGRSRFALYRMFLDQDDTSGAAAKKAKAATQLARLHYYSVRVLSPYQMLAAFYRLKGYESTLADTLGGLFVFDEIHAYEVKRLALILGMINYLARNYGAKFCIMSATFPDILKGWLFEAVPGMRELDIPEHLFEAFRRHRIALLDGEIEDETSIQKILKAAEQGSALVCCNTVRRAQTVYELLKNSEVDLHLELLHGRFNAKDRVGKEQELLSQMGTKNEPEAEGTVLVATQVVEVSLDIDFDTIFTEPAPLDALLQRFGRVNRGQRYSLRDVHVFREPREKVSVYDELLVQRTLDVLERENGNSIDEWQAKKWLDEVYAGAVSERWKEKFAEASRIFRMTCVDRIFPYRSDRELAEQFYEMFDGIEVVPACFEQAFNEFQESRPLEAGELPVTVSWGQFARLDRAGLIRPSKGWAKVADVPYDREFGLRLDAVDA